MRLLISVIIFVLSSGLFSIRVEAAWAWGNRPLVVIDGQEYSDEDFAHWWEQWRDNDRQQPEGVTPFVDWLLIAREAEKMELYTTQEFQRKVEVFLKARALMALKYDEVDSKVTIDDATLRVTYEREYVPRRLVGTLEFATMAAAGKFLSQFGGQGVGVDRLRQMADGANPSFTLHQSQWLRPLNTPKEWQLLLATAEAGRLLGPLPLGEKGILLHVVEIKPGEPADFAKKRDAVANDLRKRQEQVLTETLVRGLKTKYHVRIDDAVLTAIDLAAPEANDLAKIVIDSDRSKVTVGYFLDQCRKESEVSKRPLGDRDAQMERKRQIANTMIANSLVDWEALDRHYEAKPPLQWAYQFYRQNRLVAELESRTVGKEPLSEAEAMAYYQGHPEEFRHDEQVRVVLLSGDEKAVRAVWTEALTGADLLKSAGDHGVQVAMESTTAVPIRHFSAPAQQALATLHAGDFSQPFADGGQTSVVKLVERVAGGSLSFAQVEKAAREKALLAKKAELRGELIKKLRSRSTVVVNDEVWAALAAGYRQGAAPTRSKE